LLASEGQFREQELHDTLKTLLHAGIGRLCIPYVMEKGCCDDHNRELNSKGCGGLRFIFQKMGLRKFGSRFGGGEVGWMI
jgi:hypothetical protein